jgi:hypothetical protein
MLVKSGNMGSSRLRFSRHTMQPAHQTTRVRTLLARMLPSVMGVRMFRMRNVMRAAQNT